MSEYRRSRVKWGIVGLTLCCLFTSTALADIDIDFEAPTYSAFNGLPGSGDLNGQDGWYTPDSGGTSFRVYSYADNELGLPGNPNGGGQFAGLSGPGTSFGRSQRSVDFSGASVWTFSYDVAHAFNGTLPATQNLGSLSTQIAPTGAHRQLIALHTWSDLNTAENWNAGFNVFDADGAALGTQNPGEAWNNLLLNNWYRESFTLDLASNRVLSVSLTDLSTDVTNSFAPTDWYLAGGATGGGLPLPTEIRLFAGGGTPGNISGWDNISMTAVPEPGSATFLLSAGLLGFMYRRRLVSLVRRRSA